MIVCEPKEAIAEFVSTKTSGQHLPWENYSVLGLLVNGKFLAGIVYNHYSGNNICAHIAGKINRELLYAMFDYPFNELGVNRITGLVPKKNKKARKFDEHLGFKLEGCMRKALPDDDLLVYGMLRSECKWLSQEFVSKLKAA